MVQASLWQKILDYEDEEFTFIDLFAGIGGTRLAFESVGGQCIFSSEWNKYARKTYTINFGEEPHGDITKISTEVIPDFDILLAGFPCQPFSSIGKRLGFLHETQGTLFYDVARIIKDKRPKAFMLENVQGLITHDKGRTLQTIMEVLNNLGYSVQYKVLNSANFGVPQMRKRIYIVGFDSLRVKAGSAFKFPKGSTETVNIGDFIEDKVSDKYSISKHLQDTYLFKLNDGRPKIVDKTSEGPIKTLVASYHKIQRLTGTFVRGGTTGIRLLTENECKALMGFPEDFIVPVSRTRMYRQFGNSVVIPVVAAIASNMKPLLKQTKERGNLNEQRKVIITNSEKAYI